MHGEQSGSVLFVSFRKREDRPDAGVARCEPNDEAINGMRDRRFVAVHRGGPLDLARHRLLAMWAADCAEHVLPLFENCSSDDRPRRAIETARAWARGEVRVGAAQKAAVAAHAAAREATDKGAIAVARAAGHAAA